MSSPPQPIKKQPSFAGSFREGPIVTALPDPDNKKWHDQCYYAGDYCFQKYPLLHDIAEGLAPDTINEPDGALEKACGLVIFSNILVACAYGLFGYYGYDACMDIRFLSLVKTPIYCEEVKNAINDKFALDDNGYWDSFYEWAFAESMCSGNFVDFETTDSDWPSYSKGMWKIFDDWNTKWAKQPSVDNLMSMVVSEEKVDGKQLLLANVLANPSSLMDTNFKDSYAENAQKGTSFQLTYTDSGDSFFLGSVSTNWDATLPKWKFASNLDDDTVDPIQGVTINKYSLWVAAAVNMGMIELKDLTKLTETSMTSAYSVSSDDEEFDDDDGDDGGAASACSIPSYYQDGYCDSANNVAACNYDGGDCCESTCGADYEPDVDCGEGGYTCSDPDASDYGQSETVVYDDDAFDDGFVEGTYYYYDDDGDDGSYYSGSTCVWYNIYLSDDACDGWQGNYLHIGKEKFTLSEGCNSTEYVCLERGNTYKPYACGGDYPSEISWILLTFTGSDDVFDDAGGSADDDGFYKVGFGSVTCDWEYCGSVTLTIATSSRRLTEDEPKKLIPQPVLDKQKEKKQKRLPSLNKKRKTRPSRRKLQATPTGIPTSLPSAIPTALPTLAPTPVPSVPTQTPTSIPTHSPTLDYYYNFGLTEYVLFKYYQEMDPIDCAFVNGSQYCWVKGNAGERASESEYLGAYLFPIIQAWDKDCYNCSSTAANNPDKCNDVDLEFLLFFNPNLVSQPHFIHTYNASYQEERRKYDIENAGLEGMIYMNMYGGVEYLNELFYPLPDTHCTKPIKIAKGLKSKNALSCGTRYQKGLVTSKKKSLRKTAKKSYCVNTPSAPQERYFECRYSPEDCVSTAIAEASGQAAIVAGILLAATLFIAIHVLDVPKSMDPSRNGGVDVGGTGFLGKMTMYFKGMYQKVREICKKKHEDEDEEDGGKVDKKGAKTIELIEVKQAPQEEVLQEAATIESLQMELNQTKAAQAAQEAQVKALNAKLDKLLGVNSNNSEFSPASKPTTFADRKQASFSGKGLTL